MSQSNQSYAADQLLELMVQLKVRKPCLFLREILSYELRKRPQQPPNKF